MSSHVTKWHGYLKSQISLLSGIRLTYFHAVCSFFKFMLYQGSIYYAQLDVPECILLKKNKISAFHQVVLGESAYSYKSVDVSRERTGY